MSGKQEEKLKIYHNLLSLFDDNSEEYEDIDCPKCGNLIYTNDEIGYLEYKCSDCNCEFAKCPKCGRPARKNIKVDGEQGYICKGNGCGRKGGKDYQFVPKAVLRRKTREEEKSKAEAAKEEKSAARMEQETNKIHLNLVDFCKQCYDCLLKHGINYISVKLDEMEKDGKSIPFCVQCPNPKCGKSSKGIIRDGYYETINNSTIYREQKYLCRDCGTQYTLKHHVDREDKRMLIDLLRLNGKSIREVSDILKIPKSTVHAYLKKTGKGNSGMD